MNSVRGNESLDLGNEDGKPLMIVTTGNSWSKDEEAQPDGPPMRTPRPKRAQRRWATVLSLRYALDTVLLLVIFALLVASRYRNGGGSMETSGDVTGFAPTGPSRNA